MAVFDNRVEDALLGEITYLQTEHQLTKDQIVRLLVQILHYIIENW